MTARTMSARPAALSRTPLFALTAAAAALLTACGSTSSDAPAAESVTVSDAWVKAAEEGMSAAFGTLENTSGETLSIISVTTAASPVVEMHETVEDAAGQMAMQEKDGGFEIPAEGSLVLEPGGNHIMLMDLAEPLLAGAHVSFTVTFDDDSTLEFSAPVKDFSGANESYHGEESDEDEEGHGSRER